MFNASRYGHVGTVGIPLARPLRGFLFVVREICNQLLDRFQIFKCTWYRSSSLAFMLSRNTFAYWAILLCRAISPFADFNILTALLPVSHTKTVFQCMHKAVGLFHRLWTPSRWPAVSPHTFVRVCVPQASLLPSS